MAKHIKATCPFCFEESGLKKKYSLPLHFIKKHGIPREEHPPILEKARDLAEQMFHGKISPPEVENIISKVYSVPKGTIIQNKENDVLVLAPQQEGETTENQENIVESVKINPRITGTGKSLSAYYSGSDLGFVEKLISAGFCKDMGDLQKKSVSLIKGMFQDIGGMDKMINMSNGSGEMDFNKLFQQMMMSKVIETMNGDKKMSPTEMYIAKMMMDGKTNNGDSGVQSQLQQQIRDMQQNFQNQILQMQQQFQRAMDEKKISHEMEDIRKQIIESKQGSNQYQIEIEKIRRENYDKLDRVREENTKIQQKILQDQIAELRNKLNEEKEAKGWSDELADKISQITMEKFTKDVEKGLGRVGASEGEKKSSMEIFAETIGSVADRVAPAINDYMAMKSQKARSSQPTKSRGSEEQYSDDDVSEEEFYQMSQQEQNNIIRQAEREAKSQHQPTNQKHIEKPTILPQKNNQENTNNIRDGQGEGDNEGQIYDQPFSSFYNNDDETLKPTDPINITGF